MAVNPAVEGRTYNFGPHTVTREELVSFARAVRAQDLVHLDTDAALAAGFLDVVATPTFAVSVAQRAERFFMEDPDAGVDYSRLVHGEESFTYHAPIVAGDELIATTMVARVRAAGGHSMVTLNTDVRVSDGPRVSTTSMVVIRGEEGDN